MIKITTKKLFIISTIGVLALLLILAPFNINSKANSNSNISLPDTKSNPKISFITLKDKNADVGLRIYPKLSKEDNVSIRLKSGTKVTSYSETITNDNYTWVKVDAEDKTGWIIQDNLTDIYINESLTLWQYKSDETDVTITKHPEFSRRYKSDVFVAKIKIANATQFKHVFANANSDSTKGPDGTVKTVPEITSMYNPIIAINASGYYGAHPPYDNSPHGTVGARGEIFNFNPAYPSVLMGYDGTLNALKANTKEDFKPYNPFWIATFDEIIVNNGATTFNTQNPANILLHPRTAIGQGANPNEFIIIVVDGRRSDSIGVNLHHLAEMFKEEGARLAYNLDGGGSTTLTFNGKIINQPCDTTGPRKVIDALFVRDIN